MLMAASRTPSSTMAVAELATNQSSEHFHFAGGRGGAARVTANQFRAAVNVEAHGKSANYLFVDGHAENLAWTEVQRRLAQTNSTFLVP
jgi:prepilin-type processing-associated H-X9-DG protein